MNEERVFDRLQSIGREFHIEAPQKARLVLYRSGVVLLVGGNLKFSKRWSSLGGSKKLLR